MKLTEALSEKYSNLKLFDVVYDKGLNVCTVTLLYPFDMEEVPEEQKGEINNFIKEFLLLNAKVRVKYKRSFLDDNLIVKEIRNFFDMEYKALCPYLMEDNITISKDGYDVTINITLNQDVLSLIDEHTIRKNLKNYLTRRFIANFEISITENQDSLPEEIDYEYEYLPSPTTPRYNVNVIKKVIGKDIVPRPEYIKNIDGPKEMVIVAGIMSDKQMRTFTIKRGKHQGEEKRLYTFKLTDDKSIECIYFCAKSNQNKMDHLENGMMLLCSGVVQYGLSGNLTLQIKRISFASPAPQNEEAKLMQYSLKHKQVVFPEPLLTSSQGMLFEEKPTYNDFIASNTIVIFDLETTGLDPENCEITELGAVKMINGEVKEKFQTFVNPHKPIPEEVVKKTGITDEMVAHAPDIEDVIADFYDYTRGCILSGYNVIGFDMKFIKKAAAKVGLTFDNNVIDVMIMARQSNLRLTNYKLGTVVAALGYTLKDAHRAYNDAYATSQVLLHFSKAKSA